MRNNLKYIKDTLYLDGYSLMELAAEYGTPLYVYSESRIVENFIKYQDAFSFIDNIICYSIKANYNSYIVRLLASLGSGADVLSGGELFIAERAQVPLEKIVFAGVGKSEDEIRQAVRMGICLINIESAQELDVVSKVVSEEKIKTNISFRINPDVDAITHQKITTGIKETKFGIPTDEAIQLYKKVQNIEYINVVGVHIHIGSQITGIGPFQKSCDIVSKFIKKLKDIDIAVKYIDIGGGLGINYNNIKVPTPHNIADVCRKYFSQGNYTLIVEPGRSIVGDAGYLLTEIKYIKESRSKNFVVVDAGFNDLIRPTMYDAYHEVMPVSKIGRTMIADIVGPVCETGDFIARERKVEGVEQGNILAVCDAGAYCFSMSSNYNSRARPAEVIITESGPRLIRRRENYKDLIQTEV